MEEIVMDEGSYLEEVNIKVDRGQEPIRIDKFLMNRMEFVSRTKIQHAATAGYLTVGGKAVKSNYKVRPSDEIKLSYPKRVGSGELQPEDIPLDIRYEDEHLLVLHKPAGLVVHPGIGNHNGTLANGLLHHLDGADGLDPERPGIVHRLDKDTSGLMVIGKTEKATRDLSKLFFDRNIERKYLAIVWGEFYEESGTVTGHIGRNPRDRQKYMVFKEEEEGKHAITHWEKVENLAYACLVKCKLETGRTHQIRVHMKHIGHPVFGDTTYGGDRVVKGTVFSKYKQFVDNCFKLLPRQALHAYLLGFEHPETGEQMRFEAEPPEDFNAVLEKWRRYSGVIKSR